MIGRKNKIWEQTAEGRDKGSQFFIEEWPASVGEAWALRVFLALSRSGIDVPPEFYHAGMQGLALMGLRALQGLRPEEALPLLDELMQCVSFIPNPKRPDVKRPLLEDDIQEIFTRMELKMEVFKLHVNFSAADAMLRRTSSSAQTSQASSTM